MLPAAPAPPATIRTSKSPSSVITTEPAALNERSEYVSPPSVIDEPPVKVP
jgi:hypothetical protein